MWFLIQNLKNAILIITLIFFQGGIFASEINSPAPAFELIVLGDSGGSTDGNLSAFLLRSLADNKYLGLDAGTLANGIEKALQQNAFDGLNKLKPSTQLNPTLTILHDHVAAYMISHAHLDHIAGLVIVSPDDKAKPIFALPSVNQAISQSYFNWQAWPNFSDRGQKPHLSKYKMIDMPLTQTIKVPETSLNIRAFSLSHPVESTAFVIESEQNIVVYFGDTGPDEIEKEHKLAAIWQYLAAQLTHKKLRGIIIETSFPDNHPDKNLFGHLTPNWLSQELSHFSSLLNTPSSLQATKIIISHVKSSTLQDVDASELIKSQLEQHNNLGLHFIMAKQGQKILL